MTVCLLSAYRFGLYSAILFATTVLALVVGIRAWRFRSAPGAIYLFLTEIATAEWAFAGLFEAAATDLTDKVIWSQISYMGIGAISPCFLLFALGYSRRYWSAKRQFAVWLFMLPLITLGLALTNGLHGWIWSRITLDTQRNVAIYEHGPWFWIAIAYHYVLTVTGIVVLIGTLFRTHQRFRLRLILLTLASLFPIVGNVLYVFNLLPLRGFDWTPVALALTGLILVWGVYREKMLELVPVARDRLFEHLTDGVLVVDTHDRIVDANSAAQQVLDLVDMPLVGRSLREVLVIWDGLLPVGGRGITTTQVVVGRRELRFVEVRAFPLFDRSGGQIGRLIVLRDFTEQRRTEEALRDLNATLEQVVAARTAEIEREREKSEAILRSVGSPIVLVSRDMTVLYANQAFAALTGYAVEEALGRSVTALGAWPEAPDVQQTILVAVKQGRTWRGDIVGRRKSGQPYEATLTVSAVHASYSDVSGYVLSYLDISERRALERARQQFIANVSHSFRTPVAAMKLCVYMLQKGLTPEKVQEYLKDMAVQVSQLEQLVQDILAVSVLHSGRGGVPHEIVNLAQVAEEAVGRYYAQAKQRNVALELGALPAEAPLVYGDHTWLVRAVEELVENGVVYTPAGGNVRVGIEERKEGAERWLVVTVQDNGPGIPPDEQKQLWEPFFRGEVAAPGHVLGTGLGLSIVQQVACMHGGHLSVESVPGQGSTFGLWLPYSPG